MWKENQFLSHFPKKVIPRFLFFNLQRLVKDNILYIDIFLLERADNIYWNGIRRRLRLQLDQFYRTQYKVGIYLNVIEIVVPVLGRLDMI